MSNTVTDTTVVIEYTVTRTMRWEGSLAEFAEHIGRSEMGAYNIVDQGDELPREFWLASVPDAELEDEDIEIDSVAFGGLVIVAGRAGFT